MTEEVREEGEEEEPSLDFKIEAEEEEEEAEAGEETESIESILQGIDDLDEDDCAGCRVEAVQYTPRSIPGKASHPAYRDEASRGFVAKLLAA